VSFGLAKSRLLVKVVESVKPCSVVEICLISVVKVEIFCEGCGGRSDARVVEVGSVQAEGFCRDWLKRLSPFQMSMLSY
jgi:hypothetical protein